MAENTVVLPPETRARVYEWCRVMQERWDELMLRNVDELDGELVSYAKDKGSTNTTILKVQACEDLVMEPWPLKVPAWADSIQIDALDWPEVNAAFEGIKHRLLGDDCSYLFESHSIYVEDDIDPNGREIRARSVAIDGPEVVVNHGYDELRFTLPDAVMLGQVLQAVAREFADAKT